MLIKGVKSVNWIMYKLYCHNNGLVEGNLRVFTNYMKERLNNEYKKTYKS